ncbi:TetR/AcrR family transcriptional regulator [uncultured Amnibacterium sp.]|uniref:TetR/AcrR family transcriptional regulator n=1 Tax=uncultured Amnibacterium sp. TaxID=1631851 RepID=UPI0035C9881A
MTLSTRGRRTARPSGDDRQRAIVEAFEGLLRARPMADVAIDEIAAGASISRSAFYFYFPSKHAVLLELLDRMVAEVDERLAAVGAPGEDAAAWWRSAIAVFVDVFGAHRAVTVTLAEARATVPELRDEWARRSGRWVELTASTLVAERRRGRAREIVDPRATSVALHAMNERVLVASFAGEQPALAPEVVLDVLADIWCATIYGTPRP